jgi:hypothetical protein
MGNSAARTIRYLQDDRQRIEAEKRAALLRVAELEHELSMLRHMRYQITGCLLDRRTNGNADHTLAQVSRVIRNTRTENRNGALSS